MPESQSVAGREAAGGLLVLGVDTCGPAGTVALARIEGEKASILGQKELAGRTYSATLVAAVADLLAESGLKLGDLGAIAVVNGPGSFTGVRVGVSAVKGLAEPGQIPAVAVSRLAVLAAKAGAGSAALDAHRHEVFLRVDAADGSSQRLLTGPEECSHISSRYGAPGARELLAGPEELTHISSRYGAPGTVAACDDAAAEMVMAAWGKTELVRVEAPTAADAIRYCIPAILAREFADLALLDGHYLRRSDAEIFGGVATTAAKDGPEIEIRQMTAADLDVVMEIAGKTDHAPKWSRQAYVAALDPGNQPRRIALVAEDRRSGTLAGLVVASVTAPDSELETIVTALPHQRRGVARELFAALKHELRRSGVVDVVLEVREGNQAARSFYRFLGFREEGRRTGYYADPAEDAVLMRVGLR